MVDGSDASGSSTVVFLFFFGFVVVVVVVCFLFSFSLISPRSASQLWTCPCCICVLTEVVDRTLVQS